MVFGASMIMSCEVVEFCFLIAILTSNIILDTRMIAYEKTGFVTTYTKFELIALIQT